MNRQPAERCAQIGFSEIAGIRNRILELGPEARLHALHGGEPLFETPDFITEAAIRALRENRTRYAPSSGIPELRAAIVEKVRRKNRIPAEADHVVVTTGGLHGLLVALLATVNPDDDILIFSPYWTPMKDVAALAGGRLRLIPWVDARREGFRSTLERYATPHSRTLLVNTPANPTGTVLTAEELAEIAEFVRERDLVVISDEAYEDVTFETPHVSIAALPGMFERTVSVFTLSKSYAMTGWRVGYVVAPEPWMSAIRKLVLNTINVVSTPMQWAAVAALTEGEAFIERARAAYRERRDRLVAGLRTLGFACEPPQGTFYAFPNVEHALGPKSWEAFDRLLKRAGVSTVPGVVFGPHGEGHLRFTFSVPLETIDAALEAIKTAL
jgi:aspartate/methionine/tyrosine aminotransferase